MIIKNLVILDILLLIILINNGCTPVPEQAGIEIENKSLNEICVIADDLLKMTIIPPKEKSKIFIGSNKNFSIFSLLDNQVYVYKINSDYYNTCYGYYHLWKKSYLYIKTVWTDGNSLYYLKDGNIMGEKLLIIPVTSLKYSCPQLSL